MTAILHNDDGSTADCHSVYADPQEAQNACEALDVQQSGAYFTRPVRDGETVNASTRVNYDTNECWP